MDEVLRLGRTRAHVAVARVMFGFSAVLALAVNILAQSSAKQENSSTSESRPVFRIFYHKRISFSPLAMDAPIYNNIYAVATDGSNEQQLTHDNNSFGPVLSSDGKKIAFLHIKPKSCEGCIFPLEYELAVMNADETDLHFLTDLPGCDVEIRWPPSGKTPAYGAAVAQLHLFSPPLPAKASPLYLVAPDGESALPLRVQNVEGILQWSPDGKWLAHGCPGPPTKSSPHGRVCLSEINSPQGLKFLSEGLLPFESSWSPDSTRFTYISGRENHYTIYVARTDGSVPTPLTLVRTIFPDVHWSPDATQIAFVDAENRHERGIYVINADGSGRRRLTPPKLNASQPMWAPGGERIAFTSLVRGKPQTDLMNADGTDLRPITPDSKLRCSPVSWLGKSDLLLLRCAVSKQNNTFPPDSNSTACPDCFSLAWNLFLVSTSDSLAKPRQLVEGPVDSISYVSVKPSPPPASKSAP